MLRFAQIWTEYAGSSTIHGIGHFERAKKFTLKIFWAFTFVLALAAMVYQIVVLFQQYFQFEKRTNIEMRFEVVQFPAVTVCSLNPYKQSEAKKVDEIKSLMTAYAGAVSVSRTFETEEEQEVQITTKPTTSKQPTSLTVLTPATVAQIVNSTVKTYSKSPRLRRRKRSQPGVTIKPCSGCDSKGLNCKNQVDVRFFQYCACYSSGSKFSCQKCPNLLTAMRTCKYVHPTTTTTTTKKPTTITTTSTTSTTSLITTPTTTTLVPTAPSEHIPTPTPKPQLKITTTTPKLTTQTTQPPVTFQENNAYGFEKGTDAIALQAKAQENMPFITASLNQSTLNTLSFQRKEFIRNCAFNTKSCSIKSDFEVFQDYKYGSCFSFNFGSPAKFWTTRAGPLYGLRMLLVSNLTEYMPTTETSGVRIVIHDQNIFPFPDSFGFNAPTGTATSFSLRRLHHQRLSAPWGKCQKRGDVEYFYRGNYTVEGCQRSCYQRTVLDTCGCGDPRFPLPKGEKMAKLCAQNDKTGKECVSDFSANEHSFDNQACNCPVPCEESLYQVTVSSSQWPYGDGGGIPGCSKANADDPTCVEIKRSGVMIEVYYEQLNLQEMWESSVYSVVALVSDIAGQVGFWVGISVISIVEVILFVGSLGFNLGAKLKRRKVVTELLPRVKTPVIEVDFSGEKSNKSDGRNDSTRTQETNLAFNF